MTVTSGFFNSVNHDRKYNAEEISSIFDGIILDGVYQGFGEALKVSGTSVANQVKIGTGRAWFNHTWTLNDEALYLTLPAANSTYPRIDAIILEVNNSSSVRANTIKYISGAAASSPTKPTLTNTTEVHQYPLAYITRPKASTTISTGNIENTIGTSACPIVTGVLEVLSDDRFIAQTIANLTTDFNTWFDGIKGQLSEDVAANLANQILELNNKVDNKIDEIYEMFDRFLIGKNLGSNITQEQLSDIRNGSFTGKLGDYWYINGNVYLIIGKNTFKNTDINCDVKNRNHLVLLCSLISNMEDKYFDNYEDVFYDSSVASASDRYTYFSFYVYIFKKIIKKIYIPYEKLLEPQTKYINYIKTDIGDVCLSYPLWTNDGLINIKEVPVKYSYMCDTSYTGYNDFKFELDYAPKLIDVGNSKLPILNDSEMTSTNFGNLKNYMYYLSLKQKSSILYNRVKNIKDFKTLENQSVVYTAPSYLYSDYSVYALLGTIDDTTLNNGSRLSYGIYTNDTSLYTNSKFVSSLVSSGDNIIAGTSNTKVLTALTIPTTKSTSYRTTNYKKNGETLSSVSSNRLDRDYKNLSPYLTNKTLVENTSTYESDAYRIGSILLCI